MCKKRVSDIMQSAKQDVHRNPFYLIAVDDYSISLASSLKQQTFVQNLHSIALSDMAKPHASAHLNLGAAYFDQERIDDETDAVADAECGDQSVLGNCCFQLSAAYRR
jgi:hypothetical protein